VRVLSTFPPPLGEGLWLDVVNHPDYDGFGVTPAGSNDWIAYGFETQHEAEHWVIDLRAQQYIAGKGTVH
jgi:hypothetical protein